MAELDFREIQRRFAAHLRDPERHAAPEGIEARRMAIYRRLFINNIEDLLGRGYPVLCRLYGPERWSRLVRDFYREHGCHTPYFPRLGEEFLDYVSRERGQRHGDFPFLAELAHYERVEVVVAQQADDSTATTQGLMDSDAIDSGATVNNSTFGVQSGESDSDPAKHKVGSRISASERAESNSSSKGHVGQPAANNRADDPMIGIPVFSVAALLLAYEYAVHRIGPEFIPEAPGENPTYLVVFRDRNLGTKFIELNPLSARILWYVQNDPAPGAELVRRVAVDFRLTLGSELLRSAEDLLRHWLQLGVLAGIRSA